MRERFRWSLKLIQELALRVQGRGLAVRLSSLGAPMLGFLFFRGVCSQFYGAGFVVSSPANFSWKPPSTAWTLNCFRRAARHQLPEIAKRSCRILDANLFLVPATVDC